MFLSRNWVWLQRGKTLAKPIFHIFVGSWRDGWLMWDNLHYQLEQSSVPTPGTDTPGLLLRIVSNRSIPKVLGENWINELMNPLVFWCAPHIFEQYVKKGLVFLNKRSTDKAWLKRKKNEIHRLPEILI